jgi:hypothetical protein
MNEFLARIPALVGIFAINKVTSLFYSCIPASRQIAFQTLPNGPIAPFPN